MQHTYIRVKSPTKLESLTDSQIIRLRKKIDPRYSNTLPSIIRTWFDINNQCMIFDQANFTIIKYFPENKLPFWSGIGEIKNQNDLNTLLEILRNQGINKLVQCTDFFTSSLVHQTTDDLTLSIKRAGLSKYDYIYNVEQINKADGNRFEDYRRSIRNYNQFYAEATHIKVYRSLENNFKHGLLHLYEDWMHFGTDGVKTAKAELQAIEKFFNPDIERLCDSFIVIEVYLHKQLAGLSINEVINDSFAVNHFQKANLNISGISKFLFYLLIQELSANQIKFLNFQEDAGIKGLRTFKQKMRPASLSISFDISIN